MKVTRWYVLKIATNQLIVLYLSQFINNYYYNYIHVIEKYIFFLSIIWHQVFDRMTMIIMVMKE